MTEQDVPLEAILDGPVFNEPEPVYDPGVKTPAADDVPTEDDPTTEEASDA